MAVRHSASHEQAPKSKIQRSPKLETPKRAKPMPLWLGFGTWRFSGAWSLVLGAFAMVFLDGCAIGPNYKRPAIDSPGNFRNASDTVSTESIANRPWWDVYKDDTLNGLIETALTNNYDLRIAVARMEQARAIAMQTRSQFLPQIGYEGDAARGRNSVLGNPSPTIKGVTGSSFLALFNASWEIDLW